jgi:transposase, IS5 family
MLKLRNEKHRQKTVWEDLLPNSVFALDEELQEVDQILSNDEFLKPFLKKYNIAIGRPTLPVEVYLRVMYLKYRYAMGYESLVKEINENTNWRTFCRLHLDDRVPESTTLRKTTKRYGEEHVLDLFRLLAEKSPLVKIDFQALAKKTASKNARSSHDNPPHKVNTFTRSLQRVWQFFKKDM